MQNISIVALLFLLAGCTTTNNSTTSNATITPVVFDKPYGTASIEKPKVIYTDQGEKPLTTNDINAINAAIATDNRQAWAPQEEVLQQQLGEDI